ncbi:BnaC09g36430D [Brassica napus]|uniref:BnaC09g36430D protein n=1 Tax=Brassica napus TaxID=3708 RepID=A0A078GK56_BRANA|nr:BnaC09g36430D [Brassica napus]
MNSSSQTPGRGQQSSGQKTIPLAASYKLRTLYILLNV